MAFNATAVWRCRTGGNDANGGGYDPGISGAGTDYSQQDAAQAAWTTALSMAGTSTLTDSGASGLFTSAMVGNAVNVNSLFYFITGFTNSNNVTVDRSDTFSNESGKVGGGLLTFAKILNSTNATNAKVVPGNTVYLRHGTGTTSSPDYSFAGRITIVNGSSTSGGYISIIGENGMPILSNTSNDLFFLSNSDIIFKNIYCFNKAGTANAWFWSCSNILSTGCVYDMNGLGQSVSNSGSGFVFVGNEINGNCTSSVAGNGTLTIGSNGALAIGNYIHDTGDTALSLNAWATINYNIISKMHGTGAAACDILVNSASFTINIMNNTCDGGAGDGIRIAAQADAQAVNIYNNIISNHTGGSKYGINVVSGSTALTDLIKGLVDYNCLYNNTNNYGNISAGAHDITSDPKYTGTGDFRLQSSSPCIGAGYPGVFLNGGNNQGYTTMGALTPQVTGGGASGPAGTARIIQNIGTY